MRILNVTAQKPDGTGSGVYLTEMVKAQIELGHQTAVVCGVDAEDAITALPEQTQVFDVRFHTEALPFHVCGMSDVMPYPATRYRDLTPQMALLFEAAFTARVRQALREFEPDVILCHHLYLVTSLVRECAPEVPVGAVCHSTDLRQMATHRLERRRILQAIRSLDAIFALHEAQAEQIVQTYGVDPARVCVIGTGINTRVFSPDGCAGVERVPGRICYAGKIWGKKGVPSLLRAADSISAGELPEDTPALRLRLAGGRGEDDAEFAAITRLGQDIRWQADFLGKLPQTELAREYHAAEVYCLPSFYEGLPLVVVEALACGCKVVTTDLPGVRPWLLARVPDAPVVWVEPPAMASVDTPVAEELPAFEARLADALRRALEMPALPCDVSAISWHNVTATALENLS